MSKKWFFFDINNGWYKVEFSNLNQLKIDGTASVTKPMNRFEFEYYKEFEPGLQSYKLNVICNDTRFENGPVIYYQIESTDSDFCKKYPENSLIEVSR